jgi:hypothetical protein
MAMTELKKVRKGCTKAILIYLGLGVYGFICAILGWVCNDFFTGHHDHPIKEVVDSVSVDNTDYVNVDTTEFYQTNNKE